MVDEIINNDEDIQEAVKKVQAQKLNEESISKNEKLNLYQVICFTSFHR